MDEHNTKEKDQDFTDIKMRFESFELSETFSQEQNYPVNVYSSPIKFTTLDLDQAAAVSGR